MKLSIDMLVATNKDLEELYLVKEEWDIIQETIILLEPMYMVTILLSGCTYITMSDIQLAFLGIFDHLNTIIRDSETQYLIADSIRVKLKKYWNILDTSSIISTILDLRSKLLTFEVETETTQAISNMRQMMNLYTQKITETTTNLTRSTSNITTTHITTTSVRAFLTSQRSISPSYNLQLASSFFEMTLSRKISVFFLLVFLLSLLTATSALKHKEKCKHLKVTYPGPGEIYTFGETHHLRLHNHHKSHVSEIHGVNIFRLEGAKKIFVKVVFKGRKVLPPGGRASFKAILKFPKSVKLPGTFLYRINARTKGGKACIKDSPTFTVKPR
ncbi:592_t:CDS:2 [Acaulospora morrowiae]|uniref:592_t:CDS:1 n=1 Tax=Acaulospora morrowiae TaxID=94023 RepID=A0A9N9DNW1_9GLOM|nr:592_t:CDS:2 [Acaulospora morrowiae]